MTILLSIILNVSVMLFIVFLLALALTSMLNPTASLKEIFNHWAKTYNKEG